MRSAAKTTTKVDYTPHYIVRSIESERVERPTTGTREGDLAFSRMLTAKVIEIVESTAPLDDSSGW